MRHGGGGRLLRAGSLIALAACCAALAGCGGGSGHSSITLYNGQHAELTSLLAAAFEKATGIKVQIRTNDSAVLADQIIQEGDVSPADVYISENSPELMELQERGLLAQLPRSILSQAPGGTGSPTGHWVGMALRVSSLVYDPALMPRSQLPASILELAQPQWKGKVAIAPTDSDFPPLVGAVIATHGEAAARDWLAGLKRNARIYQDEEAIVAAVNRGDVSSGVINQYYWYRLQLELGKDAMHSALYYFSPDDVGAVVNVSGAASLRSSNQQKNAERFISFLVGNAGQQIIARSDDFEYPVHPGVAPNDALPPLASIGHTSLTVASLGNGELAARLIREAGLV
ncbi:MAG TPA: extracellular solute-binding protein [Gaiellaceae bacterium]|nr:extracellular solute-binding protein [Gaiellaceae bacterium]